MGTQVFVQIGPIPKFAWHYITESHAICPEYTTILITDQRVEQLPDGVRVVELSSIVTGEELAQIDRAITAMSIDTKWRENYWPRIFGRFLALRNLCQTLDPDSGPLVHLECDMASYATAAIIESYLKSTSAPCLIPFIDDQTACPGIVIAQSPSAMAQLCDFVLGELSSGAGRSDMSALALAGHDHLVAALPTRPEQASQVMQVEVVGTDATTDPAEEALCIFDAAAVGQYLFGIDPRNNAGILVPGYRETRGGLDPGRWTQWTLARCPDGLIRPTCIAEGRRLVLLNVHIHAKTVIDRPAIGNEQWQRTCEVANGLVGARPQFVSDSRLSQMIFRNLRHLA